MPDESNRIRKSSISAMNNMLFLLNSIDPRADPKKHPKLLVIFNDVSKYELLDSAEDLIRQTIAQAFQRKNIRRLSSHQERISVYLQGLKAYVKEFYLQDNISDSTEFGDTCWEKIKKKVCQDEEYIEEEWFKKLSEEEKNLIQALKKV